MAIACILADTYSLRNDWIGISLLCVCAVFPRVSTLDPKIIIGAAWAFAMRVSREHIFLCETFRGNEHKVSYITPFIVGYCIVRCPRTQPLFTFVIFGIVLLFSPFHDSLMLGDGHIWLVVCVVLGLIALLKARVYILLLILTLGSIMYRREWTVYTFAIFVTVLLMEYVDKHTCETSKKLLPPGPIANDVETGAETDVETSPIVNDAETSPIVNGISPGVETSKKLLPPGPIVNGM